MTGLSLFLGEMNVIDYRRTLYFRYNKKTENFFYFDIIIVFEVKEKWD